MEHREEIKVEEGGAAGWRSTTAGIWILGVFIQFKQTHTGDLPWEQGCWAADSHTETDVRGKDEGQTEKRQSERRAVALVKERS